MNDNNYLENLPINVQNFIKNSDWQKRVYEISKKYSLTESQTNNLAEIVTLVLVGLEEPENFPVMIIEDLGITRLLAEQIINDVDTRVFEYALKQIEGDNKVSDTTSSNEKLMSSGTQLELKPDNLPVVEANEPLRVNPVPTFTPKPAFQNEVLDKQTPIGVPRYAEEVPKTPAVNPILEKKLGGNVGNNSAPIKYERDPYREPIN